MSMQWDEATHGGLSYNMGFVVDSCTGNSAYVRPQVSFCLWVRGVVQNCITIYYVMWFLSSHLLPIADLLCCAVMLDVDIRCLF